MEEDCVFSSFNQFVLTLQEVVRNHLGMFQEIWGGSIPVVFIQKQHSEKVGLVVGPATRVLFSSDFWIS